MKQEYLSRVADPRSAQFAPAEGWLDRLSRTTLETALTEVAGYVSWRPFDPGADFSVDERYAALPRLTKADLRQWFPSGYLRAGQDLERGLAEGQVVYAQTSGSTEDQVTLVFDPAWWEASERAAWQLNRHARRVTDGHHAEVVLASARCVGPGYREQPRPVAERTLGRHLYLNEHLSPFAWTADDVRRMAAEWNAFAPVVAEADPAYLAPFLQRVEEERLTLREPRLIFLTYSFPARAYLRRIRRTFSAPIASSYGSTETGHVFMECEAGRLHQNTAHCRVDFLPFPPRHGGPGRGRLLVTVFHNPWFLPLRFDVGDVGRLAPGGPCPCGRGDGLTLETIEGRLADVTYDREGRAVTVDDLDRRLTELDGLRGWQLLLPAPGRFDLTVLASEALAPRIRAGARDVLANCYGPDAEVQARVVPALRAEPSGKFRFVCADFPVVHEELLRGCP